MYEIKSRLIPYTLERYNAMIELVTEKLKYLYQEKFPEMIGFPIVLRDIKHRDDLSLIPTDDPYPWRYYVEKGKWKIIAQHNVSIWKHGKCFAFYGLESKEKPLTTELRFTLGAGRAQIRYLFNVDNVYNDNKQGYFAVLFESPIVYAIGANFTIEAIGRETGIDTVSIKGHVIEEQGFQVMG